MAAFDWSTKWGFLVIPAVCGFGCLTNLISVLVFINPKMKDNSFKYLLAIAICNIFYLGLGSYSFLYICTGCPSQLSYFTNVYYNYVVHYVCSTLSIFCILADIYLSLLRYLVLKNKTFLQNISYLKVCPILFFISSLFYIAPMFLKEIKPIKQIKVNNTVVYTAYFAFDNSVGATPFGKTLPIVITSIRIILATVVLTSVNVLNALEFRKRYSKRVKHTTSMLSIISELI
jgi:hypothetical protein